MIEQTHDQIIQTREALEALNRPDSPERSRELSLAITQLEQAELWIERDLNRRQKRNLRYGRDVNA